MNLRVFSHFRQILGISCTDHRRCRHPEEARHLRCRIFQFPRRQHGPHPFRKSLSLQFLAPSHDATFPVYPILAVWAYPSYILYPFPRSLSSQFRNYVPYTQVNSETTSPIHAIQRGQPGGTWGRTGCPAINATPTRPTPTRKLIPNFRGGWARW